MALTEDELYEVNGGFGDNLKSMFQLPTELAIELARTQDLSTYPRYEKEITRWEQNYLREKTRVEEAEKKRLNEFRGIR